MTHQLPAITSLSPGENLNAYIQNVNAIPVLTRDEEQDLSEAYYYKEDLEAARKLVLAHLRFVVHIARSYSGYGLSQADLIQEGNVGLMKAVKRFNPERGVRLVSFAVHWVKAEMHEFILRNWRIVKVATTKAQRKLFFNLRSSKKSLGWLTNDEANALAKDLGVEVREVRTMEGRMSSVDMGFDVGVDDDSDTAYQMPANYLESANSDPALLIEHDDSTADNNQRMTKALAQLDDRSRDILQQRWLNDSTKSTLHELADQYGVSAERIRQLEKNAMNKMRDYMTQ